MLASLQAVRSQLCHLAECPPLNKQLAVSFFENLELLARPDIVWTDSCAAMDHPMIDHFWRERRTVARHSIAIGGKVRRLVFRTLAARETGSIFRGIG